MHMNLRVLELMWGQMTQLAKQQEIITQAQLIIERTQLFAARLEATEKHMKDVMKDFMALKVSTAEKGKSIITPAKRLISLGAQHNSSKNKVDLTQIFVEDDDELLLDREFMHEEVAQDEEQLGASNEDSESNAIEEQIE
jgi:DNA recombination protein RmuC